MNITAYGGGVNSTAMLVGLCQKGISMDLILFADTGGELPSTYAYLPIMNQWLIDHGMPEITVVEYTDKNGDRLTLEQECLRSGTLPALPGGLGQRREGGQVHRLRRWRGTAAGPRHGL